MARQSKGSQLAPSLPCGLLLLHAMDLYLGNFQRPPLPAGCAAAQLPFYSFAGITLGVDCTWIGHDYLITSFRREKCSRQQSAEHFRDLYRYSIA
jgi:hypothetical protein